MSDFSFLGWNVDQAVREERPGSSWDERSGPVKELIKSCKVDLIALLELRDLETSKESTNRFLSSPEFDGYDKVQRRYCHWEHCFSMVLMVDQVELFVTNVRTHTVTDNPQNDSMIMFVDLQSKKDPSQQFTVGVTHFKMQEDIKWISVHILRALIAQQPLPTLVYGDYNFFEVDDNKNRKVYGAQQRAYMLEKCVDLAYPLFSGEQQLTGTFLGFPHDEHHFPFKQMSRLDHIFAQKNGIELVEGTHAISPRLDKYQLDNTSIATFTYPSDHLALQIWFHLRPRA